MTTKKGASKASSGKKSKTRTKSPTVRSKKKAAAKAPARPKSNNTVHFRSEAQTAGTISDKDHLLLAYREMFRARRVDEKTIVLYKQNKCHFQIGCAGHEAIGVAAGHALTPAFDWAYPYYRGMGFCAAWGMTNREFLLNAMNKAGDPNSGGRMMPMHYGHQRLNIVNQSSPTGSQLLQAVGAAKAIRYRGGNQVVYVSLGDGTTSQGDYHEALNWAAREKLPLVIVVENNGYAISVPLSEQTAGEDLAAISGGYKGLDVVEVDGISYLESFRTMTKAVTRARSGKGPTVVVAHVVRLQSHSISDNQAKYRDMLELEAEKQKDPLTILRSYLINKKLVTAAKLEQLEDLLQSEIHADSTWAEDQPDPTLDSIHQFVLAGNYPGATLEPEIPPASAENSVFMVDAINHALDEELEHNPEMVVFGEDVAHGKGGVFAVTAGLTAKYGKNRVFNSPLAESSIVGTAVGMATLGMKPVVEIQFGDYVWTGMNQLRNELSNMYWRSNGTFRSPAVLRIPIGGYINGGVYHSQNLEATFSHFPGLVVLLPSNARDAKGLLKSAIRCPDPVLFLEHKGLYRQVYAKGIEGGADELIPIGKARIARPGRDATVLTWGALVQKSLVAAERLAQDGYEIEVVDLRSIVPLDVKTILESVKRTHRLLIAHEDVLFMGFGAELAALVAEQAFEYLDAPIRRLGGSFTNIPHSPILERAALPQNEDVERMMRELVQY